MSSGNPGVAGRPGRGAAARSSARSSARPADLAKGACHVAQQKGLIDVAYDRRKTVVTLEKARDKPRPFAIDEQRPAPPRA